MTTPRDKAIEALTIQLGVEAARVAVDALIAAAVAEVERRGGLLLPELARRDLADPGATRVVGDSLEARAREWLTDTSRFTTDDGHIASLSALLRAVVAEEREACIAIILDLDPTSSALRALARRIRSRA